LARFGLLESVVFEPVPPGPDEPFSWPPWPTVPTAGPDIVITISDSPPADQDETSIAHNPANTQRVVAVFHDLYLRFVDCGYAYSNDGASTWTHNHRIPGTDVEANCGDPVVAFDTQGNAYYSYLWGDFSFFKISVGVSKSVDGGVSWGAPKVVMQDPDGMGFRMYDKEWIEVDTWPSSPNKDTIYLTATFFNVFGNGEIVFTRSTDGGSTYSPPVTVSDPAPGTTDQLSMPAPAPDGDVYVVWLDLGGDGFGGTDTVKIRRGFDGGTSWGPVRTIQSIKGLRNIGESRAASNPSICVAPKPPGSNPNDYNIYVAYAAIGSDGEPEIRLAVSQDKGSSWTVKRFDNNNFWEFFPAIYCLGDGTVHAIAGFWSPSSKLYRIAAGTSTDGGGTWTVFVLSDQGYNIPPLSGQPSYMIGDYFDLTAVDQNLIYPAWTARLPGPETDIITDNG